MSKKRISTNGGIVFSTHPDSIPQSEEKNEISAPPAAQNIRVILDKKQRAGKTVTVVYGFQMNEREIEDLGKQLKTYCGTGGTVKNEEIIIQGDHRDKITDRLRKIGYSKTTKL